MPRFDPAGSGRLLTRLTPHELRQAEGMLGEARERAEAVMEIGARAEMGGPAAACPRCGGGERVRRGRTRTGAQRWRCSGCGASWSGRSGTPIARVHRPDLMAALVRDRVVAPQPLSCRRAGRALGLSRDTIWRWRMAIIGALPPAPQAALAGIVEADEAHQRESRKGSQEWVRHRRDPKNHPAPQVCATAPALAGLQASWRVGDSAAGRLARLGPKTPCGDGPRRASRLRGHCGCGSGGDLGPTAAGNGARCGALHGRSRDLRADRQGPTHPILRAQRRTALEVHPAQPSHQYVNALIGRFRSFMQPFCGPASRNLAAYGRWHAARDNVGHSHLDVFRLMLASGTHANTVC